jgi:hypothetical protein
LPITKETLGALFLDYFTYFRVAFPGHA